MNLLNFLNERTLREMISFLETRNLDKDEIKFGLELVIERFESLPEKFKIYRIVKIEKPSLLDKTNLGVHWTLNKNQLLNNHYYSDNTDNYCIVTAYTTMDLVKLKRTIELNVEYPNEQEILLDDSKDLTTLEVIGVDCGG